MQKISKGFVYCVTSQDYLHIAQASIRSLRDHHSEPITLFLSRDSGVESFKSSLIDNLVWISPPRYDSPRHKTHPHFLTKNLAFIRSPYDRSIFLDADTIVCEPLYLMWTEQVSIATIYKGGDMKSFPLFGKPQVNTGVVGFGPNRDIWLEIQQRAPAEQTGQQRMFQKIFDPEKVQLFHQRWNLVTPQFQQCDDPAVVHFQGRSWIYQNKFSHVLNKYLLR